MFTPRDAHSECNIPSPVGSGLVPDRKGSGVGSVTSTPRDNVHPPGCSLGVQHPLPSRGGVRGGVCNFNAKRQCPPPGMLTRSATSPPLKGRGQGWGLYLQRQETMFTPPGCSLGVQHPLPSRLPFCECLGTFSVFFHIFLLLLSFFIPFSSFFILFIAIF